MFCHERTAGRDSCWRWPTSNAGQLPAFRDPLEPRIGRRGLGGPGRDLDRRLVVPVRVPEDHPQRDPASGREEQRCQRHVKPEPDHLSPPLRQSRRRYAVGHQRASSVLTRD
jgi:hypothetical protein